MVGLVEELGDDRLKLNLKREDFEEVRDAKIQSETQNRGKKVDVTCIPCCR